MLKLEKALMKFTPTTLACLTASLLLMRFGAAQDLGKKVDYATVAVPLSRAMTDLAKQTGGRLTVSDELADEVIVLRLKDVTADEALKRIAGTVGAEWKKVDGGLELQRSGEVIAKLRAQGLQTRVQAIRKMIDKQLKSSGANEPLTLEAAASLAAHYNLASSTAERDRQADEELQRIQKALPDNRTACRVLSFIDPADIAPMEAGERLVFSNRPTMMQKPIQGDVSEVGLRAQEEHNLFASELKKLQKPDPNKPTLYGIDPTNLMPSAPVRFVVSLQLQDLSQVYMVRTIGFDAANIPVFFNISSVEVLENDADMIAQRARVAKATESEPDLPVSHVTQLMLDFMKKSIAGGGAIPAQGDLRTAFLNPDKIDPLAYVFSDAFLGIADRRNENLVAYPEDSAFLLGMFAGMEGRLKPSLVMQAVSGLGPMIPTTVTESDGWLTLAPANLMEAARTRTSRPILGEFLRTYDANGYLTLASVGKLASAVSTREFPVLDLFLPMMIDENARVDDAGDLNMLKLYASLDEGQLTRLNTKQAIRVAELRPEQAAMLSRFIYEKPDEYPGPREYNAKISYLQACAEMEPTESIPNGLPNDTLLTMSSQDTKVYFVKQSNGSTTYTSPMGLDSLAWTLSLKDHPERSPGYNPTVLGIQPGKELTIQMFVAVSPSNQRQCSLKEHRTTPGGPWTLDKLPSDVKTELDAAMARYNQMGAREIPAPVPASGAPPNS